jgi:hypothetical protein
VNSPRGDDGDERLREEQMTTMSAMTMGEQASEPFRGQEN